MGLLEKGSMRLIIFNSNLVKASNNSYVNEAGFLMSKWHFGIQEASEQNELK